MKSFYPLFCAVIFLCGTSLNHAAPAPPRSEPTPPAKDAATFFDDGVNFLKQNKYSDAREAFTSVTKMKPDYAEAFSNLGYSLRKLKNYKLALENYDRAIKLKPALAAAHEYRGEA